MRRVPLIATLPLLAACGTGGRVNHNRPPAPINVTAAIHESSVELSPTRIGGGPVVIIISNQSDRPQRARFAMATTPPIPPHGTARLSVDVSRGSYRLAVRGASARLRVGARRRSAQDDLLQP